MSNNEFCVPVTPDNRQYRHFFVQRMSDANRGNHLYFDKLSGAIAHVQEVAEFLGFSWVAVGATF